ncbi:unnamed protein product, partial [Bubo scandiacus]
WELPCSHRIPAKPHFTDPAPTAGVLLIALGKGEADDPKAHVSVTPATFLSLVPGGMLGVRGQDQ